MKLNYGFKYKMTRIETLNLVECFSLKDWKEIDFLSKDKDPEIRLRIAELLGFHHNHKSEEILFSMLYDEDELVRAEACDSLFFSHNTKVQEKIIEMCLFDNSVLVRGYAVLAIGDIQSNIGNELNGDIRNVLIKVLTTDTVWVQIAALRTFVLMNNVEYEVPLIKKICSNDYVDRKFAISMCEELLKNNKIHNLKILCNELKKQKLVEKVSSVQESICLLISSINQRNNGNTEDGNTQGTQGDGSFV